MFVFLLSDGAPLSATTTVFDKFSEVWKLFPFFTEPA